MQPTFHKKYSGFFWVAISVILLFGYAALVIAAGPFAPGATLDPIGDYGTGVCSSPTDVTCYVTTGWSLNTVSGYVYSATSDLVGIGDSTPTYKLDVNGDIAIGDTGGTSEYKMYSTSISTYADMIKLSGTNLALGAYKTAVGAGQGGALGAITSGANNIAIGQDAGIALTTGSENIFIGNGAGDSTTTPGNTFIGYSAGGSNVSGVENVFVGWKAGQGFGGDANTLVGYNAGGLGGTGTNNVYIGSEAGGGSANLGTGNVFVGAAAGSGNAGGINNTLLGYAAGDNITDASSSIIIGASVDEVSTTAGNQLNIGNTIYGDLSTDFISIGTGDTSPDYPLDVTRTSDGIVASFTDNDTNCTIDPDVVGGISCTSDERKKTDIENLESVLDSVRELRPVTYAWKNAADNALYTGFIAQEVRDIYPELIAENQDGYLTMSYAGLTPILTKAVQELDLNISDIEARVAFLPTNQTFLDGLRAWFADAANGITSFFAGKITTSELCVDDVCVTRDEFRALLQANNISGQENNSETEPEEENTETEEVNTETPDQEESTETSGGELPDTEPESVSESSEEVPDDGSSEESVVTEEVASSEESPADTSGTEESESELESESEPDPESEPEPLETVGP